MNLKLTLLCLSLISIPTISFSADEDASVFDEIVVTARKRAELSQSVPIPISALNEEQLEMRNIVELTDIEKLAPNLSIQLGAVNSTVLEVFMRGIGQSNWAVSHDPKIGLYTDGVYSARPQGGLVDLYDIQRVEVLRGPQGTLFGKNTTAGLINIITNTPSQEREAKIRLGAGSDSHQLIEGMFNTPINDSLSFRFSFLTKETDGFMINSITGKDRGNEDTTSFRAQLRYDNEAYSANLAFSQFEQDERAALGSCRFTGPENGALSGGLGAVANIFGIYDALKANCRSTTKDISMDTAPSENVSAEKDSITLSQSYETSFGTIESISNYAELDSYNGTWGWMMGNGPGVNFLEILDDNMSHKQWSQELRLTGSSENMDWVVGLYAFEEDAVDVLSVPLFRGVNPSPLLPAALAGVALQTKLLGSEVQGSITDMQNQAIFFEGTYAINDQLDLTLGARYTEDEREFTRTSRLYEDASAVLGMPGTFNPLYACPGMVTNAFGFATSDRCTRTVEYSETTPRAILSYQQTDDVLFYASYSKGYSSGGFNGDVAMRRFLPETSDNYEFGMKGDFLDNRLRVNATMFSTTYENQQVTVGRIVNGTPIADLVNAQEATLEGMEFEILAQLTDSLVLSAMVATFEGEYDEFVIQDNTTITNADGSLSTQVVERDISSTGFGGNDDRLTWDLSLMHTYDLGNGSDIQSTIGISYHDEENYTLEDVPSSVADDYELVDARITWNLADGQSSIALWGTNLTDEDYVNTMLSQSGDIEIGGTNFSLGMTTDYWGQPRRYGIEYRRNF
ncbi:TonB-dependent receptor [Gammaproteobacteria bacterium]|nr:TonB-dependent receptor [Gammaproteobacteria bacterium]MDC0590362.1 TonB-dependent receptor [Gammaproteobacteria bacterium]MDC1251170.1 TonB-dependent receptor [Gammaproteobacteria bacterium]MDC3323260.1 TonB-dependent receptor [Gammaproteobacteria bacterium]